MVVTSEGSHAASSNCESTESDSRATLKEWMLEGTPEDVFERYAGLSSAAKQTDFGEYDENVVVIDTETTGVSIKRDELTQIAAARLEHGEAVEWFVTFVNPGIPIPEDIVLLTNITDEDVAEAPAPEEALEKLVEFVGDAKLVAHNAYFDKAFVTKHPTGYPLLENQWIDSLELARISLPRMKSHRLIDLVKAFGAPLSTHRADDDVVATCALYRILLAAVDAMPEDLLGEIASFATPEKWPFGEIFNFFAKRKMCEASTFSLSSMRDGRVTSIELKEKQDAAGMVSAKMLEAMESRGMTVTSSDSDGPKLLKFPIKGEIEEAFSEDGVLGEIYDDYEQRKEQLEMALAVRDSFEQSERLVVEAGTGIGKSMAYLVPAVLTAKRNGVAVGVATKTNALLDQLVYKELPALSSALGGITFAPLKGYTHYPCLLRIQRILREKPGMRMVANEEKPQAPALAALLSYIEQTAYDDMDSLKIDYRVLPRQSITTTSNDCLRRRCPFYGNACFVQGSRKLAECVDVVVTNHSLLFYDIAAENALLPPIRYWVVDEAHGVEDEARRALSLNISIDSLARLTRRVSSEDANANVYLGAARAVKLSDADDRLFHALIEKAQAEAKRFAETEQMFAANTTDLLYYDTQKKSSYELFDLWINQEVRQGSIFATIVAHASDLVERAEKLTRTSQELVALMEEAEGAGFAQREVASVALELKVFAQAAESIFLHPTDEYVYSVTLNRREGKGLQSSRQIKQGASYHAQLYSIGAKLDETLYETTRSVVYTSATLTVNNSFQSFADAVGLEVKAGSDSQCSAKTLKLDSSFDFDENMRVFIASDMPEPVLPSYMDNLQRFVADAHVAQGGSMLTLFTNKRDMDRCYEAIEDELKQADLRLVCQRKGVSVKWLRDEFLANETLSLFALKSFWEGFDAPGATLRGVIIPKLPFASPSDPLSLERKSRDDNAWHHYDLPKAVIEVRQAAGRLIRKASDTGVLVLADSRLLTKWYGSVFVGSLPSKNVRVLPVDEIVAALAR